jgi:uncharacterized repeat protein (TIGR01451 family)
MGSRLSCLLDSVKAKGAGRHKKLLRNLALAGALGFAAATVWSAALSEFSVTTGVAPSQPSSIKPGEATVLRITLTNASASALAGVNFNKALTPTGSGNLLVDGATATVTCTGGGNGGGTVTLPGVGNTLSVQLASLTIPARVGTDDGVCTIDIPVKATSTDGQSSTQTYTLAGGDVSTGSGDTNGSGQGQGVTIQSVSRPTWNKGFGTSAPATANASGTAILGGDTVYLTFRVANPSGGVPLTGVEFEDVFPTKGAGGAIIEPNGVAATYSNCGTPTVSLTQGNAAKVAVSGVSVAVGQTCVITVPVRARQTNAAYELLNETNTLLQSSFDSDQSLKPNNSPTATVTVRSPLRVTKNATARVASGGTGTFTITLYNYGTTPLPVAPFNETSIDGGTNKLTPNGINNTCGGTNTYTNAAGGGIQTTGYSIPAASGGTPGTCVLTVNYTGTTIGNDPVTYTNTIPQGAVTITGQSGIISQTASAATTIIDELFVDKAQHPARVAPGSPVRYTVTISNFGSTPRSDVHLNDALQNGATFLVDGGYAPTLTPSCGSLTGVPAQGATSADFIIQTLPAFSSGSPGQCAVTFWAMTDPNGSGNTQNVIPQCGVWYGSQASTTCNGEPSNTVTATEQAPLLADKTFNGSNYQYTGGYRDGTLATNQQNWGAGTTNLTHKSAPEGTVVTMRIRVRNYSDLPLTGLTVGDTLPTSSGQQLLIATPANASSTCGGTLTATPGLTSVQLNNGTVPARVNNTGTNNVPGMCEIQVDVVGPAGNYDNTAHVSATQPLPAGGSHLVTADTNAGGNTPRLTYTGALAAVKTFEPAQITTDGKSTVRIRLTNSDTSAPITGISVTDPLPAAPNGLKLADPPNVRSTCAGSPVYSGAANAAQAGMSGASLPPSGSCDFLFDVVNDGAGSGNWVNTIPIGNITADGGIKNQSTVTGNLTRVAAQVPTISKAINPGSVAPGQTARLTITITSGTQALTGLAVTDHFTDDGLASGALTGIKVAATPNASTTCSGGIVTAVPEGTSVALSGASLDASTSCTVDVDVIATNPGAVANTIPLNSIRNDQGQTNTGTFAYAPLTTSMNMGLAKSFTPDVVKPNERTRLRITILNATQAAIANFGITDNLPPGMTVPAGPNVVQTCGPATQVNTSPNTQVVVSGGAVGAASGGVSASCYVELDVVVSVKGKYTNTLPAQSITVNGVPTLYPPIPVPAELNAVDPLVVHKAIGTFTLDTAGLPGGMTTGEASRAAGAVAPLLIHLSNPNNVPLTGLAFTDVLPAGLVVAQTPNASTTCGGTVVAPASATEVRLAGGSLTASGSCTVTVDVLSNNPGEYTNTIPSGGVTTTEGVKNEEPTRAKLNISKPPTVGKQFDPAVIPQNGISKLTIFLRNENATAITLSEALVDTLPTAPGAIVVAATPNVVKSCPGAVTATAGAGTVTYANGATIPIGGCTITVDVTGNVPGAYNNNIPAGALKTNVGQNPDPANAPLQISTQGYISGKVFRDNNTTPNGTFEPATDAPIPGQTINLYSGPNCSGTLAGTTTTDAQGNYLFSGLAAGNYSVCQPNQPDGTINGITTAGGITQVNSSGGTPGAATNQATVPSAITNITLGQNGSNEVSGSTGNNFAEIVPSSISGTVFLDQNNNGVQNGADAGIPGQSIELRSGANCSGPLVTQGGLTNPATTDGNGNYRFDNLPPGNYSVCQPNQPVNTSNGKTVAGSVGNGGTPGTPSAETSTPSAIANIVLPPNTTSTGNNFAELPYNRTVSGRIFLDYNANGTFDPANEYGIGGQTVTLTGTDENNNPVTRTTTTNPDGTYSFTGLPPGTYKVTQPNQPTGTNNGTTTPGTAGGTAANPNNEGVSTSEIVNINLSIASGNTVSAGNDFAETPGNAPDLTIGKTHSPGEFTDGGTTGFYTITSSNIGQTDTVGPVTIVDTLPAGITPTAASGSGWNCAIAGQVVTCTTSAVFAASGGTGAPIILHVNVAPGLAGQLLVNTAVISGGGEPNGFQGNNKAEDPTPIIGTPAAATLAGHVWRDLNHDRAKDPGEPVVAGWTVELLYNGVLVKTTATDQNGAYKFEDLPPGSGYQVRFRNPDSGAVWGSAVPNEQGMTYTPGTVDATNNPAGAVTADGTLKNLTLVSGQNVVEQSLPLDPAGVVYDAVTRQPVQGAVVTITGPGGFDPAIHLVGGAASVTTGADGQYQFLLMPGAPAGEYRLAVTTYPGGYLPQPSDIIPVCNGASPNVGGVPNPALVQASDTAPGAGVTSHDPNACQGIVGGGAPTTQYYFGFILGPGSANVLNNHIPLDPILGGAIIVTKTTPLMNVTRGDLVPYTITATNTLSSTLPNIDVQDQLPPGFKYRSGSANLNGVHVEPKVAGRQVTWANQTFAPNEKKTYKLILVVGAGVGEGEYVNQAWALNSIASSRVSNVGTATVRVVPDPTFDCSDIIGTVFDDKNANGYQDQGEPGIPNVRVATARGLLVTTDAEGRFHVACAAIPQMDRGSNFVMKLDDRTLPSGFRVTTENPRDVRVTRGKMVKLNFGATVHRVMRVELDGRAFAADKNELLPEWQARLPDIVKSLQERPSVLRLAYRAGNGDEQGKPRLKALAEKLGDLYQEERKRQSNQKPADGADEEVPEIPPLIVETEIFNPIGEGK